MKQPIPLEIGRIVISKAGRDKGTAYAVLALLPEDRALVADGRTRPCDHPKKKNVKHLAAKPECIPELSEWIAAKKRNADEELRKRLEAAGYPAT